MEYREYIEQIKQQDDIIKKEELKKANLIQKFKREHSFLEGDKVKLTRTEYNATSGKEEITEYYLFIRETFFDYKRYMWMHKFSYITSTGKQSEAKCGIFFRPEVDKLERIK